MRQVPHYAIIGNGRVANHMSHYFDELMIPYQRWYRSAHNHAELNSILTRATHVLVLISDKAIEGFIQRHVLRHQHLTVIHCSGCLSVDHAFAAHPLQTFKQDTTYALSDYQQIPFIIDEHAPAFSKLLPGLNNPHYRIKAQDKAYYHALCVLANNFTTLLWQKFSQEMGSRFGIANEHLIPFIECTFQNIQADPSAALTGPIARKDWQTLSQDLKALQGDPFHPIFASFVNQFVLGEPHENGT